MRKLFFTSFQQQQSNSGRRVAPVMGNRGLESQRISQDRSRTKTKMGQTTKDSSRSRGSPRTGRKTQQEGVPPTGNICIFIAIFQIWFT